MTVLYQNHPASPMAPARMAFAVALSDTVDQARPSKAFRAGKPGTIRLTPVEMPDGSFLDHPVLDGEVVSLMVKRFWATGTTSGMTIIGYSD
ncbi:MAG: hypothetical protein ABIT04_04245 [Novosphingobium sp.]